MHGVIQNAAAEFEQRGWDAVPGMIEAANRRTSAALERAEQTRRLPFTAAREDVLAVVERRGRAAGKDQRAEDLAPRS